jgi:hypothetical protein
MIGGLHDVRDPQHCASGCLVFRVSVHDTADILSMAIRIWASLPSGMRLSTRSPYITEN